MSVPSWCFVGAKVVCVTNKPLPNSDMCEAAEGMLVVGATYILRDVAERPRDGHVGVRLRELGPLPFGFLIDRFRPLVTEKDDLEAHFNELLTVPHRVTEGERA